jgi:hypothetical protein|tara:strand:- start:66 stop:866 length:801 start_codon:yes stop_codon:yes gene_type:complete
MRTILGITSLLFSITVIAAQDGMLEVLQENKRNNEEALANLKNVLSKSKVFSLDESDVSDVELYKRVNDSKPPVDELFSVYMGDTMIQRRAGYYADCVIPKVSLKKTSSGQTFIAKAKVPICKTKAKDKRYAPLYLNFFPFDDKSEGAKILDVSVKDKKGSRSLCWHYGFISACGEKLTEKEISVGKGFVSVETELQQTIEYAGKRGNIARFIYSEFNDGSIRDAFTRDFEADLSEDSVVAYKGLVFEVVKATNSKIHYKVIRHFP